MLSIRNAVYNKSSRIFQCTNIFIAVALLLFINTASAATSRNFTEFEYDSAGNLTEIRSNQSELPPQVNNLTPAAIRIGLVTQVTATGADLDAVEIFSDSELLRVQNIRATSTEVLFDLTALNDSTLGAHTLTFRTPLGETTAEINVGAQLPGLLVGPSPLALTTNGQLVPISVQLSSADTIDHTINLAVTNPAIADITASSVTILAGETQSTTAVSINAFTLGATSLEVTSATLTGTNVSIFVTEAFSPFVGDNTFYSAPLGVFLTPQTQSPALVPRGPFTTQISVLNPQAPEEQQSNISPIVSSSIGVSVGRVLNSITPNSLNIGSGLQTLTIAGSGLDAVTEISVIPPEGITLGTYLPESNGLSAALELTISDDALTGIRQLVLSTSSSQLPASSPASDRLQIAFRAPQIRSIDPIIVARGTTSLAMTVRGENLQDVQNLNITPATGMVSSTPQANSDGTVVTVVITIPESVPLGPRQISVTTPGGTTGEALTPANTLTVVNAPGQDFESLASPDIGVILGQPPEIRTDIGPIVASNIGLTVGPVVTGLSPAAQTIGSEFTLTIQGSGFAQNDLVDFFPNDDVIVGTPIIAADGNSISVPVTIAEAAQTNIRTVFVLRNEQPLPVAPANANRFQITGLLPIVDSLSPNFMVIGSLPSSVTVRGQFLTNATQVRVLPSDGLSVGTPNVNDDGTLLTFNVSSTEGTIAGQRLVIVDAPAGSSSLALSSANTLSFANQVINEVTPLHANSVGVVLETPIVIPEITRDFGAPLVGVVREQAPIITSTDFDTFSTNIGVTIGAFADILEPSVVGADSTIDLIIRGEVLGIVNTISFIPPEGVSLSGPLVINSTATELTVPVTFAANAVAGLREVVLETATGQLIFSDAQASRLRINDGTPEVLSIDPIQQEQGQTFAFIIRGLNLFNASLVTANSASGITFSSTPVVNSAGTEISVQITISADAPIGPRLITVFTPAGSTSVDLNAANTFTVIGATP